MMAFGLVSYFYFGSLLGEVKKKEEYLFQQGIG